VVVIDIAMPTEDGTQIAAWVRKEHPDVRVVVYTAFTKVGNIKLLIDAVGAHAFLQKPFDADDLYKAVTGE
jgi:DNA-binding NarL/FixJ family response regulator